MEIINNHHNNTSNLRKTKSTPIDNDQIKLATIDRTTKIHNNNNSNNNNKRESHQLPKSLVHNGRLNNEKKYY